MMTITNLFKVTGGQILGKRIALIVAVLFSVCTMQAQNITISGSVTDAADGAGLPLANVVVKGTTKAATTDFDGKYTIDAKDSDILVFSYMGYADQEIAVAGQTTINVSLASNSTAVDEVVVIGYGTQKKSDLTGSVSVVNVADAKKTVTYDVAKMLQGQAAGVTVQSSGEPGGFVNIKIRGIGSFTNNNPLFVVDNIILDSPYDFAPGDIESIQVL
ncbi:MAG: carboxypeptidase-like regulatory domain-containing protein, partial [Bacteroidota bacterium]